MHLCAALSCIFHLENFWTSPGKIKFWVDKHLCALFCIYRLANFWASLGKSNSVSAQSAYAFMSFVMHLSFDKLLNISWKYQILGRHKAQMQLCALLCIYYLANFWAFPGKNKFWVGGRLTIIIKILQLRGLFLAYRVKSDVNIVVVYAGFERGIDRIHDKLILADKANFSFDFGLILVSLRRFTLHRF